MRGGIYTGACAHACTMNLTFTWVLYRSKTLFLWKRNRGWTETAVRHNQAHHQGRSASCFLVTGWFVFLKIKQSNKPTEGRAFVYFQRLKLKKVRSVVLKVRSDVHEGEFRCVGKVRPVPHEGEVRCAGFAGSHQGEIGCA